MRAAGALLAILLLAPLAGAFVPTLPLASDTVPRIETSAQAMPGAGGSVLPLLDRPEAQSGPEPGARPADEPRGLALGDDPQGRFLADLAQARSAFELSAAYRAYGAGMGWTPMPAVGPPSSPQQFNENSTISYTHDIGDVDRDGVRDLAMDVYCTAVQGCPDFTNRYGTPSTGAGAGSTVVSSGAACQEPHILLTVSGYDGHELRNMSLDQSHAVPVVVYGGCTVTFVIGTIPLGDGTAGILLYTVGMVDVSFGGQRIDVAHDLRLLDMKTGEPVWTFQVTGGYHLNPTVATLNIPCNTMLADNMLLNPLQQQAPVRGVSAVPAGNVATLDVQGVGYNYTVCTTWLSDGVVFYEPAILLNDYQPVEWMARLEPTTGEVLWRVDTFQPGEQPNSVIPRFLFQTPLGGAYPPAEFDWDAAQVVNRHAHYWNARPCCFDLTGDGINDLAATTLEFTDTPSTNSDGLYGLRSRLVVFDGATGARVSATLLVEDVGAMALATRLEPLGDADGDGDGDLLVHVVSYHPYFRHVLSIRGGDGAELWRIDNPHDLDTLVVGDADRDGGNDFLLVEWTDWEGVFKGGQTIATPYTNVSHMPLKVFSGRNGEVLWRHDHFGAVIDYVTMLGNLRANGVPDLDGDGVADVPTDDPTILPDRTVLHRLAFINPRTDKAAARIISAGSLAMPAMAGDSDGDGRDDLLLLNGDINDLWLTMHDPDGKAQWSRRIATPRLSGYASAVPTLRTHEIDAIGRDGEDLLLNFQLSYITFGSFIVSASLSQQITGLRGGNGTLVWATPGPGDANLTQATPGASPASALFARALARDAAGPGDNLASTAGLAAPGLLVAVATGALGFFGTRRLRL